MPSGARYRFVWTRTSQLRYNFVNEARVFLNSFIVRVETDIIWMCSFRSVWGSCTVPMGSQTSCCAADICTLVDCNVRVMSSHCGQDYVWQKGSGKRTANEGEECVSMCICKVKIWFLFRLFCLFQCKFSYLVQCFLTHKQTFTFTKKVMLVVSVFLGAVKALINFRL